MPDPVNPPVRTFTEQEAYALVADNVQRETAAAVAQVETLTSEKAALETTLEVAEAALATEKARADGAIEWHEAFVAKIETEKANAGRKDARVAKVRETAKHLKEDDPFFTPERADRWAQMDDAAFESYLAEIAAVSSNVAPAGEGAPPRETAMQGQQVAGAPKGGSLLGTFLGGPKAAATEKVGA